MKPRNVVHVIHLLVALAGVLAAQGCEERDKPDVAPTPPPAASTPPARTGETPPPPSASKASPKDSAPSGADNTARNTGDADKGTPTPITQGENETDLRITAEIRKALVADSALSTNAHNCKVITKDGVVVLRGPVETQAEKDAIASIARATAGVNRVVNELEVKS